MTSPGNIPNLGKARAKIYLNPITDANTATSKDKRPASFVIRGDCAPPPYTDIALQFCLPQERPKNKTRWTQLAVPGSTGLPKKQKFIADVKAVLCKTESEWARDLKRDRDLQRALGPARAENLKISRDFDAKWKEFCMGMRPDQFSKLKLKAIYCLETLLRRQLLHSHLSFGILTSIASPIYRADNGGIHGKRECFFVPYHHGRNRN